MPQRLAGSLALLAFAVCLLIGGIQTGNPFSTTVLRALLAMVCTYIVGLVIGWMGERMLNENVKAEEMEVRKSKNLEIKDR